MYKPYTACGPLGTSKEVCGKEFCGMMTMMIIIDDNPRITLSPQKEGTFRSYGRCLLEN